MSKEFKIGLITIVAVTIFYFGFNFLKSNDAFSTVNNYHIIYDNISGLDVSDPIFYKGMMVGRVEEIKFLNNNDNKILVTISVQNDLLIRRNSVAILKEEGLLGNKAIELKLSENLEVAENNDTLLSNTTIGLQNTLGGIDPIINKMNISVTKFNELLIDYEGSGATMKNTAAQLAITLKIINEILLHEKSQIYKLMESTNALVLNTNNQINNLTPLIEKSNNILDTIRLLKINDAVNNFNSTLQEIDILLKNVNQGKGTLGKIAQNDSLYNNLNTLLITLNKTAIHFNEHPKDFFKPLGRDNKDLKGLKK